MSHSRPVQVPLKSTTRIGCFPAYCQLGRCGHFKTGGGTLSKVLMYFFRTSGGSCLFPRRICFCARESRPTRAVQGLNDPGCHGGSAWRRYVRGEYMVPNRGSHPQLNPTSQSESC